MLIFANSMFGVLRILCVYSLIFPVIDRWMAGSSAFDLTVIPRLKLPGVRLPGLNITLMVVESPGAMGCLG